MALLTRERLKKSFGCRYRKLGWASARTLAGTGWPTRIDCQS
jgi:hypothetical protein